RLPGGRVDRASLATPAADARGARADAGPRDGQLVHHRPARGVLHDQGLAGPLHRPVPPLRDSPGGAMTPLRVSIFAAIAALILPQRLGLLERRLEEAAGENSAD